MGKWIESPDQPKKRNLRATLLVWILGKLSKVVDFLTLDLMTGKSWVKKDVAASLRSAEASPHEAERPAVPADFTPESEREKELRIAYVVRRSDVENFQKACERVRKAILEAEINALVGDVREGDSRG